MRESLSEADAIGSERVECRSFDLLVSIAADVVGTERVDGY
jgi:hypothetical protein